MGRGPFYEKSQNSKIFVAGPVSPAFRPIFLRPWAKIQNSGPNIFFAWLSGIQKGMTQPPDFKTLGGDRFGRNPLFRGPGPTLWAPGSVSPTRKLLAKSLGDPENLDMIHCPVKKLWTFFAETDGQTDRRTDGQIRMPSIPYGSFFF